MRITLTQEAQNSLARLRGAWRWVCAEWRYRLALRAINRFHHHMGKVETHPDLWAAEAALIAQFKVAHINMPERHYR